MLQATEELLKSFTREWKDCRLPSAKKILMWDGGDQRMLISPSESGSVYLVKYTDKPGIDLLVVILAVLLAKTRHVVAQLFQVIGLVHSKHVGTRIHHLRNRYGYQSAY